MNAEVSSGPRTFRNEPRRRFTVEYKRQVVRALLASPMSLARVARDYDLNHNQLARWRHEYERGKYGEPAQSADGATSFLSVSVEPAMSARSSDASAGGPVGSAVTSVELHLPKGKVVIHNVSTDCLLELIEALR
jgi:transposase